MLVTHVCATFVLSSMSPYLFAFVCLFCNSWLQRDNIHIYWLFAFLNSVIIQYFEIIVEYILRITLTLLSELTTGLFSTKSYIFLITNGE